DLAPILGLPDPLLVNLTPSVLSPFPGGPQGFAVFTNPDGSVFTGTDFAQRGGAYRFQGLGRNGYKQTAAGTIAQNNEDLYLILPLTRYNAFARGNYEINDWLGVFGQALFSHVSTYTRNEPGPITTGWDVNIPYGNQIYMGDAARGVAPSVDTNPFLADGATANPNFNVTHADSLAGGRDGLNCPTNGGCATSAVSPL